MIYYIKLLKYINLEPITLDYLFLNIYQIPVCLLAHIF